MCAHCNEHSSGNIPAEDSNAPTPPIPADHAPVTPEFVEQLMAEIDAAKKEENKLWSQQYGSATRAAPFGESTTERTIALSRKREVLSAKIAGLTMRLNEVKMLVITDTGK